MLRQTVMCSSEKTKASPQNLRWVNRIIMVLRMIMLTMSRRRGLKPCCHYQTQVLCLLLLSVELCKIYLFEEKQLLINNTVQ